MSGLVFLVLGICLRPTVYGILDPGFADSFAYLRVPIPPSLLMNFPRASIPVGLGI